ncbi:MAG: SLC13 family permease [Proteobacteria bacterium]|nr:SLC13 family permease [Pseudomonadota bacterium]
MSGRVPVVLVAMGTALALYFTGILNMRQSIEGFGDPAVMLVASLFVVSAGLEATGVTAWAGQVLIAQAGESRPRLLTLMMVLVAVLSALITINGAVAALLPVVVVMAIRLSRPPSQLLMPLVFASHAGSLLALTGTPVNVLVNDAAENAGIPPFGFFSFALAGVPLLIGTIAIVIMFGERLLPVRSGRSLPPDLSRHARTLMEQYRLTDGVFQLRVRERSPLVGTFHTALDLSRYEGLSLVGVQAPDLGGPVGLRTMGPGDILIVRGDAAGAGALASDLALSFREEESADGVTGTLFNRSSGLAEVVIPPRSAFIGQEMFPGMVTPSGDLMVLAVQRGGLDLPPKPTTIAAGDTLLLQGTWEALDRHLEDPEVLVVDSPDIVRRQAVPMGARAKTAIAILLGMVAVLATGTLPSAIAGLVAACAMVGFRVVTVDQAYKAINWTTVILMGAMIPLSTAMTKSGAAQMMADALIGAVGHRSPYALLAGLYLLTAILGQLISNTATALIIIPIGVAAALDLHVSPAPVLMSIAVAAAAAFLTPVATPVNLMVMAPGGYQFGDYWKLGLPLLLLFMAVAVFVVPVFYPF